MTYFYKKSDKEKKNPVHISQAVRYKTLYNKGLKLLKQMDSIMGTLMFEFEEEETKRDLYSAYDNVKSFMDNLKVKDCYQTEE